jgi:hypothetical protein
VFVVGATTQQRGAWWQEAWACACTGAAAPANMVEPSD